MSDFFIPTQKDDYWTKKQQETQTTLPQQNNQNDYWGQRLQALQQQKEERLANYNRYGVDVPDEYYEQFNKIISQVEDPAQAQEEAYRIGSAIKYSQMYGMPIEEAYGKVDALNEAQFPDLQDQKGRFEAICDMFTLGNNNVKLGMLGQKLMTATGNNDTEMVQSLMAQIDALQQENVLLQDKTPRSWVMQALEAGAQSLPFTGYVAGAGVFGNFIAPGVGTGAAFATSSYLAAGQEYLDMRANGASHETAAIVSSVSGVIQGLIEADLGITNGIVKGTAKAMGKEAAERAAKKSLEDIGTKLAKRFHFGPGKKLLVNYLKEYGKNVLGEGTEEFLQEITSIVGQEIAASLDGYDIPEDDFNHIVEQTTEAFKGGVLGAISMGFIPAGINGAADIKSFKQIKDIAEEYESGEMFKEAVKENPVFEGMSDEQKADVLQEVWEKAQQRKEADVELKARQIAETRDAAEGAEEMPEAEEGEETQAQSVARDESGRLYTNDDGNTFLVGDATKDDANRYGYIKYSTDENGDITIDTFKMTEGREGLREELFDEFAREHPDVNINWNAVGSEAQVMRQSLIDANPSGAKNGLNYYSSQDLDQVAVRKKVAAEVRKNIHNVTKNADGSFTRTDLNNNQVAAAVTLIESAAKRMDMSLSDYVNKTFGNQIFGSREEFAQSALAQGDQINDKAGGMNQGVAQANWREVGQQVKAVIYAGENADFSTWAHEMAHVFQNQLAGDLKTEAESAFNVVDGDWIHSKYTFKDGRTMSSAEAFAYGFQDWLETGKAENAQMQNIFQKFAQFIADCYNKLRQHLNFTPEIESVFNKLLDGDDTIMSKALKAAQEEEKEYRASLKRKAEEAENTKKAEAEEAQKQAELEKEEAGEYTDYEQKTTEQSAEEIEQQLEEGNEEETGNAIDNALENLNITDEQKAKTAEVLKDETSTIVEKADAIVDAAGEQFDLFQKQEGLLYQLAGEPSIRRMAESEEKRRILADLDAAKVMDERYKNMDAKSKNTRIRMMTSWEKDANGQWKYELDDSINRIKGGSALNSIMRTSPAIVEQASKKANLNLGLIYDAPELYKVFPYMKNVRVSFYSDPNAFRAVLTPEGIKVNMQYLQGIDGEKGLKGALVHEIQHVIQAMEYAESTGLQGADIEQLYNDMMDAMQAAGEQRYDYDLTSLQEGLDAYMNDYGEIEARNVARRVMYNADKRRNTTLESDEDVKRQQLLFQEELDKEYAQAVESGDTEKAMQMLAEEAERKGYTSNSDYQGTSAFNGAAPYRNRYFDTKEKRLQAIKDEEFEDTETLGDFAYDNADVLGFDYLINDPRAYRAADDKRKEAIDNLRKAIEEAKSGKKNVTIKMYRSVPADIKEGSFRNGDWITPSKSYAEDNADVHSWGPGEYRIIEQDVDLEHIWWDGNDIAEWGYDDEKEAVYKNTENNRKLFEITYDENGDLIPLSKRFDENNPSILYQIAGEIGAQNLDNSETQEGVSRMQNLAIAKDMEADGKDAKEIRLATGWEKSTDGYWRYEIADGTYFRPVEGETTVFEDGEFKKKTQLLNDGWLPQVYKSDELYKAYPDLEYVNVIYKTLPNNLQGRAYNANGYKIELNKNNSEEINKSVIIHEIQHIIQSIEGFARGGTEEEFNEISVDEIKDEIQGHQNNINLWKKDIKFDTFLANSMREVAEKKKTLEQHWKDLDDYVNKSEFADQINAEKEKIEELKARIEEIEENALDGTVEFQGNIYNSAYEAYRALAGEIESRNVESRINFTPEQRLNTLIAETEDVAPEDKILLFQTVYHGSGANFDKFDTENYGLSGEGSMSFGYGTYLTDSEDIARDYANRQGLNLDNVAITDENRPYFDIAFAVYRGMSFEDAKEAVLKNNETKIKQHKEFIEKVKNSSRSEEEKKEKISFAENRLKEDEAEQTKLQEMFKTLTIDDVYKHLGIEPKRNLYTVEIPDDGYLNWDDPISKEDTKKIVDKFVDFMMAQPSKNETKIKEVADVDHWYWKNMKIEGLYNTLGYGASARTNLVSQFLHSIGYTGIKYPAGTIHGNGNGAYNYVIFNDDDAKIIDHLLFQTNAELMQEAQGFESWQDFMEFCEVMHSDDEVSPIPSEADAQWYQSFWETAHGLQTEQEKNEQTVQEKNEKDTTVAKAMDALFVTYIRSNPEMLDDFLHEVARIDAIDLDSDEWRNAADEMDAAQRDKIDTLKDAIAITMSDYNWQSAMRRVQGGGEISEGMRKRLMGEMTDTMKSRDFRALYAEVMEDPQYAVDESDTTSAILNKKLQKYQKRYYDIVKPGEDISKMSPEKRKRIAEAMANRDIANKIRNGSLKLDDELDAYIKSLDAQIKEQQKQYDELERETKADYQRIADAEKRRLLKLHEELLMAKSKVTQKNSDTARKINKGLKITEKYKRESQNLQANYDELFRKFNDLKNTIQITAEVQATLDRQEQVASVREDLNAKQKEKSLTAEVKKMRINLVKRTMRRVPFNRIDYDNAKTVIAIQRMLEPNLIGGVNKFIGIDSPFLRGVISQIVTDSDYKEKILRYLDKNSRSSEAFVNFKKKLSEMKSIKDFDSWTAKERKAAIKYLPKENWVKDLNLMELAKEREESIDLDIDTEEYSRQAYDENGKPKTYKDKDGIEHNVMETAFRLRYSDELGQLVKDAVGADMFDRIVNRPFSEWTTEELEQLAQRIDELYTEGRDLLAAKNEARKREAEAIRKRVEDAIKETGIVINDDDTPEEKERKQKEINKILNLNSGLKGTEAGNEKGIKATLDRLIHGYEDMNVLRFARMLDNQTDGENVYMLYRREDECYNNKTRSINNRAKAINEIMKANNITEGDLARSIPVPSVNTEFTVDELLYFLAADKDYAEDEVKLAKGLFGLDANDDWAATSRNAVMFGNMMSDTASQEQKEEWDELDKQMKDAIENDTLTTEQKQLKALGQLDEHPGTSAYIAYCHAKWEAVLAAANSFLEENPKYVALMEAIEADYASQYERMNEVSITEFNQPVHRVRAYVPLVRREQNGEANVNQVKEDLLATFGSDAGKQWVNKGMTQRRVNISPLHQKPVQTGLFATWGSSVDRTEHFIAYAPYVRQLNAVYKSRDASYTRRFLESRYGKYAVQYLDKYINEVANPNAGKMREAGSEWLHALRGKTAPAYLGWKFSAIIKQGLTSPWPYMQFVNPAAYASAALECTRKGTYDAIREKSVFMNNRVMDPMNELVEEMADEGKTKFDRALGKFGKTGMQGLEWIDWVCVAPGWLACYKKEYARLQRASEARYDAKMEELRERNMYADIATSEYMTPDQMEAQARKEIMEDIEVEAVRYADDCTRQCQPSSRAADLAPLFKNSSEAMKAFLQFQTSLNVIWQNIRYDMPYAVRNKQFQRIVGTILGYVFAGIFMNSVMEGVTSGAKDDDDKDLQALRNLIFYSTTQFTDAIPMIGSEVTNTMDQIITGKRGFMQSGTDMTPSATKLLSVLTNASKGNWEKAATLSAEAIGMAAGAPVSGAKEIYKLLGKPLKEGDVNFKRGISDVYGIVGDIIEE